MLVVFTLIAWVLAAVSVSAQAATVDPSSIDLSQIPNCGLKCIMTEVAASPCSLTDFGCICANATLAHDIEACLGQSCAVRDALKTAKFSKDMCGVEPNDHSLLVWLVPLIVIILSTICYILRLVFRLGVRSDRLTIGDMLMGICVLCTVPFLWSAFALAHEGLGKDMWNIPADNITRILELYWIDEILYHAILPLCRISILLFYLEIFPRKPMKIATYILVALNVGYFIAFEIATVFQCSPVDGAWKFWDGTYATTCNNIHLQSWISAAGNILLDLLVIILPLPELAQLSISLRKKIQILTMFCLGFFITIISIIRLKGLIVFANTTNVTYDYVEPGLFSIVESSASIICACLPNVRALLGRLFPKVFVTTHNSSGPRYGHGSKPSRQNFSRLESSGGSTMPIKNDVKGKLDLAVQETNDSSSVELRDVENGRRDGGYGDDEDAIRRAGGHDGAAFSFNRTPGMAF